MASLKELREKKLEFGTHLSNLLRFIWRCYWKRKQKKKKKKKGKKGKKKANKDLSATCVLPPSNNSLMGSTKGKGTTPKNQQKQITVKDTGGSIDLTSGDGGDAEFQRSNTEMPGMREEIGEADEMNVIEERDDDDLDRASGDAESKGAKSGLNIGLEDNREHSESQLLKVEVSILDLDHESVNLDKDSDDEIRKQEEELEPKDGTEENAAEQPKFLN